MRTDTPEERVRDLIARYADTLHVRAPRVCFVETSSGPCYEALFNRIEIDERTLALPAPLLALIVAHEVAHATQRKAMLLDFAWTGIGTAGLFVAPCLIFAVSPDVDLWRITAPGLCFVLAWMTSMKILRPHAARRAAAFELDADAKAAQLCGPACVSQALQALQAFQALQTPTSRMHIERARLEAMHAYLSRPEGMAR